VLDGYDLYFNFCRFTVKVKLHHRAKFRGDWLYFTHSPKYRGFSIFNMAAVHHLGFVVRAFGPPTKGVWWSLSLY